VLRRRDCGSTTTDDTVSRRQTDTNEAKEYQIQVLKQRLETEQSRVDEEAHKFGAKGQGRERGWDRGCGADRDSRSARAGGHGNADSLDAAAQLGFQERALHKEQKELKKSVKEIEEELAQALRAARPEVAAELAQEEEAQGAKPKRPQKEVQKPGEGLGSVPA